MYTTGLIHHKGNVFSPAGKTEPGNGKLDCGHDRPPLNGNAVPWALVKTGDGTEEWCLACCAELERRALDLTPVYQAYYSRKRITTFHGVELMRVTGHTVYRHNFGGRFVAISAVDHKGRRWHGRASFDNGNVITLRRAA